MRKKIQLRSIIILFTTIILCDITLCVLASQTAISDQKTAEKYASHTKTVYQLEELGAQRLSEIKSAAEKYGIDIKSSPLPADTSYQDGVITSIVTLDTQRLEITAVVSEKPDGTAEITLTGWKNYAERAESDNLELFGS